MLLVVFPGEGFGSSPAESSSLSQSSLLLFYPDFNKMCLNPVWCWQYLIPSCWNVGSICLDRNYFPFFFPHLSFFPAIFMSNFQVMTCRGCLSKSNQPSAFVGKDSWDGVFNTSIPSLLQSVLIKIAQGSHLHIYHSTYPQTISQFCHSWTFRRDWSATPGL